MSHRRLALLSLSLALAPAVFGQSLEAGFQNPPASAKPHTWWHWINGNISKAGITADLEAMKRVGIGGAQIFNVEVGIPAGDKPFMSPQWDEMIAWACSEAKRLGLELCIHNGAGWSSSGGPWVQPQDAMQYVTWTETRVHGGTTFSGVLPQPKAEANYYKDIAVFAMRVPTNDDYRIPNIRAKAAFDRGDQMSPVPEGNFTGAAVQAGDVMQVPMVADGSVNWTAPEGEWVLLRMGHTPTGVTNEPAPPEGRGLEVDKLSRTALDHFWTGMMTHAINDNGPVGSTGLMNALIDSYEVGSQNWSPVFRDEFKKRRGYDPLPYLPVVTGRVIGSAEVSERFLWDVRKTVCDLFAENYYGYMRQLCNQHGLKFSTEGYGNGSFDNLQAGGTADIPMGEFWIGGGAIESTKLAASSGHIYGKPIIGAESFTADTPHARWLYDPYSVKALGDKVFTLGINRYIFHRFAHQPWTNLEPGMTMGPWGMNMDRTITWWDQGAAWMKYIARSQYLLQSGHFSADVLAFTGDNAPVDLPMIRPTIVPEGYDYDGCDAASLQNAHVEKGDIVLPSGTRYKVLALLNSTYMTPKTLRKIGELVSHGATVVGDRPVQSPSLADMGKGDDDLRTLATAIWLKVRKGTVGEVLKAKVGPDVTSTRPLNWIHRKLDSGDLYFVANPTYRATSIDATFRITGLQPELWNPETGTMQDAPVWSPTKNGTQVTLPMDSAGSTFVVFRHAATKSHLNTISFSGKGPGEPKPPVIKIVSARYEATDGSGGVDVTDKAQSLLSQGETEIGATNSNFGDPTLNHVKRLHIVYTVDGKEVTKDIEENGTLAFTEPVTDTALPDFAFQNSHILAFRPGVFGLGAKTMAVHPSETPLNLKWTVAFQTKRGGPASAPFEKLISWSDSSDPKIKYFSGSATYRTTFTAKSGHGPVWLDLGKVKNFAEVTLNGHAFPTLWKAPWRLDVSGFMKSGRNELSVRVTNLWPNRLIGDEQYPAEAKYNGAITEWPEWIKNGGPRPATQRVTFSSWKFFDKNSPLLESGLLGPVKLLYPQVVR